MPLPQPWLLFSHSQNGYWNGVEFVFNPDDATEYSSRNLAVAAAENEVVAGGHYEAIQTIKKPYPIVSLAKKE